MDIPLPHPAPRDSWLAPVLRRLVPADIVDRLLAAPGESLWVTAVRRHLVSDAALLAEAAAVSGLTFGTVHLPTRALVRSSA